MQLTRSQLEAIARQRAEEKLNRELRKLHDEMEKSRCNECGFTGYTHQDWCPRRSK